LTVAAPVISSRTLFKDFSGGLVYRPDDIPVGACEAVGSAMSGMDISGGAVRRMLCPLGDGLLMGYAGAFRDISSGNPGMDMFSSVGDRPTVCFVGFYVREPCPDTGFPTRDLCSRVFGWLMLDLWEDDSDGPIPESASEYGDYPLSPSDEDGYVDLAACYRRSADKGLRLITHVDPGFGSGFTVVRNVQDILDPVPAKGQRYGLMKKGRVLSCIGKDGILEYSGLHAELIRSTYRIDGKAVDILSQDLPGSERELPEECLITGRGIFGGARALKPEMFAILRDELFGICPDRNVEVLRVSADGSEGGGERWPLSCPAPGAANSMGVSRDPTNPGSPTSIYLRS